MVRQKGAVSLGGPCAQADGETPARLLAERTDRGRCRSATDRSKVIAHCQPHRVDPSGSVLMDRARTHRRRTISELPEVDEKLAVGVVGRCTVKLDGEFVVVSVGPAGDPAQRGAPSIMDSR